MHTIKQLAKSPSISTRQDDQVPIIANDSLENEIQNSDQHVSEGMYLLALNQNLIFLRENLF